MVEQDGYRWYKARFLFAPVWVADPNGECIVRGRYGIFGEVMFWLADHMSKSIIFFLSMTDPYYEPMFMFEMLEPYE